MVKRHLLSTTDRKTSDPRNSGFKGLLLVCFSNNGEVEKDAEEEQYYASDSFGGIGDQLRYRYLASDHEMFLLFWFREDIWIGEL